MKTKRFIFSIGFLAAAIVSAHEFWLDPQQFFFEENSRANIRFSVGEGFKGENWKGNKERVIQLKHLTPTGETIDIKDSLGMQVGDSLQLLLANAGTHTILFNSANSFISLEPKKFDEYLTEDGLGYIRAQRKAFGEENKKSNEYYQRSVKTIVQVGKPITNACTKPTSLPLDIIPQENPYAKKNSSKLGFQLLFRNTPLKNYLVKIWVKSRNSRAGMTELTTDANGRFYIPTRKGITMVSAVYMERISKDEKAQWQSYWGSCTFELR
jgi:uncharacterized GH25 family protein